MIFVVKNACSRLRKINIWFEKDSSGNILFEKEHIGNIWFEKEHIGNFDLERNTLEILYKPNRLEN